MSRKGPALKGTHLTAGSSRGSRGQIPILSIRMPPVAIKSLKAVLLQLLVEMPVNDKSVEREHRMENQRIVEYLSHDEDAKNGRKSVCRSTLEVPFFTPLVFNSLLTHNYSFFQRAGSGNLVAGAALPSQSRAESECIRIVPHLQTSCNCPPAVYPGYTDRRYP